MNSFFYTLYKAAENTINHDGVEHAGYMAFMNILSLFPAFVFIISLTSFIGDTSFGIEFVNIVIDNIPNEFIKALRPAINEIISGPPHSLLTISILGAIWTASTSIEGLRTILNRIYHVKTPPIYIFRRLLSICQFLALTLIIIISMILLIAVPIIYQKLLSITGFEFQSLIKNQLIGEFLAPASFLFRDILLSLSLFLVVSILYCILPNTKLKFKSVVPGTIFVLISWNITANLVASFMQTYQQVNIIYGSLAGIIISMIFFYIINLIFIYGAELNYLLLNKKR